MLEFKQSIKDLKSLFKDEDCVYSKKSQCYYLALNDISRIPLSNDLPDFFYTKIKDSILKTNYPIQSVDSYRNCIYKHFIIKESTKRDGYPPSIHYLFVLANINDWKICLEEKDSPKYIIFKAATNPYQTINSMVTLNYLLTASDYDKNKALEKLSYLPEDYLIVKTITKLENLLQYKSRNGYVSKIKDKSQLLRVICLFLECGKDTPLKYL